VTDPRDERKHVTLEPFENLVERDRVLGRRHRETLPELTPQPLRPLTERVDMRGFHALRVPCTYIRCLRDAAVVPARAAEYAARLGVTPIDLDCAHNPMLSAVDELAKILTKLP